ncbi:MAG: amino acid ABC transporter permease [Gracilibacteraceae bacterium]|jgi:L-cystine transport system permease protein|nr:amino acid ABC transporter permease [Gracilibacteraceae bacterium]
MFFDLDFALKSFPEVLGGVPMTLLVTATSILLGFALGFLIYSLQARKRRWLTALCRLYVSVVRGTPLLVQLYIVYFAVPPLLHTLSQRYGLPLKVADIPPLAYALTAFTINTSAYMSELIRSALSSVEAGQMEAAQSVGMSAWQSYRLIILPQAFVEAIPNIGNMFLGLIKGTSLVYTVKLVEVMARAKVLAAYGLRYIEVYLVASLIYWGLSICFEILFKKLEQVLRVGSRKLKAI